MNRRKLISLSPDAKADLMVSYALKQFNYSRPEDPIPKTPALIRLRVRRDMRISRIQERFNRRFDRFYDCLSKKEQYIYHSKVQDIMLDKVIDMLYQEAKENDNSR